MKKYFLKFFTTFAMLLFSVTSVTAHAVVKPSQVGVGAFQTFTLGVPNEKDYSYNQVRLLIPDGVEFVSPNVKTGWRITTKTEKLDPASEENNVSEIIWSGGLVPGGQRDEFVFSAKVPANETTLQWKVYQTYSDGKVVSWDNEGMSEMSDLDKEKMEEEGRGPSSETKVINDLKSSNTPTATTGKDSPKSSNTLSYVAIILSVLALGMQFKKRG